RPPSASPTRRTPSGSGSSGRPVAEIDAMKFTKTAPGLALTDVDLTSVGALLVTERQQYLMQCRTDSPRVAMRGHWGVFGGAIESGESPEDALVRELAEELEFRPAQAAWFTELVYCLHQVGRRFHRKYFYEVPI